MEHKALNFHKAKVKGEDSLQKIGYNYNVNCHTNYYKIIGSPGITQRQTNLPQFDCPKRTIILHVYMSTVSNFGAVTEEMVVWQSQDIIEKVHYSLMKLQRNLHNNYR
jgi:hypothetical protein